jgi:nickel-dependent lactate racemase
MEVSLAYSKGEIAVHIPGNVRADVVEPAFIPGLPDQRKAVTMALRSPIGAAPLHKMVTPLSKVAVIFSDVTRATPTHILLPALLEELSHLPRQHITFFCALGTHRPATARELTAILGQEIVDNYRVVQNDSGNPDLHAFAGTTGSGNKVILNREVLEAELRILTGFIEPHFFAGFSGGGKALMPGMAYAETIRYNHSIAHLEDPQARWGITGGNPIWEEVMEAAEFAGPSFLLNVTLNRDKEITGVFAGDLRKAHQKGCEFARETAMTRVEEPYDIVLTSNSGYPLDLNVYQSVKGMSAAERIVKQGGNIIIASECRDGIPSGSDYETILASVGSPGEMMKFIKSHEKSLKDTWQVFFQAMIQQKAKVFLYSGLDEETVRKCLLQPVVHLDTLVDSLVRETGTDTRICVLPMGPWTIPYIE